MKKIVYVSISLISVMIAAVFLFRDYIGLVFISNFVEPKHNFVEKPVPEAPEYKNPDHWAALPERQDFADVRVDSLSTDGQKKAAVDVFFVHPTTYIGRDSCSETAYFKLLKRSDCSCDSCIPIFPPTNQLAD